MSQTQQHGYQYTPETVAILQEIRVMRMELTMEIKRLASQITGVYNGVNGSLPGGMVENYSLSSCSKNGFSDDLVLQENASAVSNSNQVNKIVTKMENIFEDGFPQTLINANNSFEEDIALTDPNTNADNDVEVMDDFRLESLGLCRVTKKMNKCNDALLAQFDQKQDTATIYGEGGSRQTSINNFESFPSVSNLMKCRNLKPKHSMTPQISFLRTTKGKYECKVCSRKYCTKFSLNRHLKLHANEKCKEKCLKRGQLMKNVIKHSKQQKKSASVPQKSAKVTKSSDFALLKTSDGRYKCKICSKTFCSKGNVMRHSRLHTGETFRCSLCKQEFNRRYHLMNHMKIHSEQHKKFKTLQRCKTMSPPNQQRMTISKSRYECEICLKTFSAMGNLKRHLLLHTKEKKYQCTLCKLESFRSDYLAKHVNTHFKDSVKSKPARDYIQILYQKS